jgi:hypothetical protein
VHLVQLLLPLNDNTGETIPPQLFRKVSDVLLARFSGLTAYTRNPAVGLWQPTGESVARDNIVIFEVMVDALDIQWWTEFRKQLESDFAQESIVMRATETRLL